MRTFRKGTFVAIACMGLLAVFASTASATHNRSTQLSWSKGAAGGEAIFAIDFVARASYYGFPEVGDTITDPVVEFGDGEFATPSLIVTEVDDDVVYTHAQVVHTYAGTGPYVATMGSCCRLSASSGHVNNDDFNYEVHTLVDLAKASSSPSIAVAPVVFCPTSGNCSFAFAGSSADPGNHLKWRLALAGETGESSFVQPGPPYAPNAATIDSTTGRLEWDTIGATLSPEGLPTYYSTQVVAEEVNSQGETVSDAAADFFISLDDHHHGQPHCEDTDGNSLVDNDGDGLCDNWEEDGIDSDHDEDIDFFLPTSADLNQPDVFVEIDYMQDREPQKAVVEDVEDAYAAHNIDLHVLIDNEIPFTEYLAFGFDCSGCGPEVSTFDTIKDVYFGTDGDRAASGWAARREARKFVFHYALYGNELAGEDPGTSGVAELPGNDFVITLGNRAWRPVTGLFFKEEQPPKVRDEAGTLMHELGHNLALWHGGGDPVNCKPNYLSVMNYTRQTTGGWLNAQLDYSDAVLPTLDENDLDEFLGVQGPSGAQVLHGPASHRISSSTGSIDWNRTGGPQGSVSADVNYISDESGCGSSPGSPGESLVGFDDWENLSLPFQATADFADGVHSTVFLQEPEIAALDFEGIDGDGDGVDNIEDRCPEVMGEAPYAGCPPSNQPGPPPSSEPGSAATGGSPPAQRVEVPARPGPPDTSLGKVRVRVRAGGATFVFSGAGGAPALGFQCRLDRRPFKACRSPKTYANLKPGVHVFRVRAIDSLRQIDPVPASRRFRVE
jgi:hypothetical protein